MNIAFLVEMTRGSVKNNEITNLYEIQFPTNCIVLPWPMYTEPRAKRGRLGTQR